MLGVDRSSVKCRREHRGDRQPDAERQCLLRLQVGGLRARRPQTSVDGGSWEQTGRLGGAAQALGVAGLSPSR